MKPVLDWLAIGPRSAPAPLRAGVLLACLLVGIVFLRAAVPKILDPGAFAGIVFNYQAAPDAAINLVALLLPWLEAVCGIAFILLPRYRPAAGVLLIALLILFIGLQVSVIVRGIDISCGCFSVDTSEEGRVGWGNVLRNAGLLLAAALGTWAHSRPDATTRQ